MTSSGRAGRILLFLFWFSLFVGQSAMDLCATLLALGALGQILSNVELRRSAFAEIKSSRWFYFFLAWIAIVVIGLWSAPAESEKIRKIFEFRWMLELGLWVWILRRNPPRDSDWKWLAIPPILDAVYGLGAWIAGVSPVTGFDPAPRVGGFFNNPMPFAHVMGPVAAALGAAILVAWIQKRKIPALAWVTLALVTVSVLFSLTRGIWAGLFVSALALPLLLMGRRGLTFAGAALIACAALLVIPSVRDRVTQAFDPARSYDSERVVLWKTNWEMFKDHPLFGIGYGENSRRLREYYDRDHVPAGQFEGHAHNQFLHLLAGTGLLGLVCYLIFIGAFLKETYSLMKSATDIRWQALAAALLAAQITFYVGSVTESNFSIAKNRAFLLFLLATVAALKAWNSEATRSPAAPPRN